MYSGTMSHAPIPSALRPWRRRLLAYLVIGLGHTAVLGCGAEPGADAPTARPTAAPERANKPARSVETRAKGPQTIEYLSPTVEIRKRFRSMEGPINREVLELAKADPPELLWITGYRMTVVDDKGRDASQEFNCHNNFEFDAEKHAKNFGWKKTPIQRLFTLSQGQPSLALPEGFGIPLLSSEALIVTTQALNLNHDDPNVRVRQRVEVDIVRDEDLEAPLRPLFMVPAYIMALVEGEHGVYGVDNPDAVHEGSSCLPGVAAQEKNSPLYPDEHGKVFTGHWVVPPGREVRHTRVTSLLDLPFDTTIHFIAVHFHPFAQSLALRDLTTDETLWVAQARNREDGIGLEHVDHFSSVEGIPVYKDHEYEMVSVYDNTTDEPSDAMATMFVYMLDQETEESIHRVRQRLVWAREAYASSSATTQ